MKNKVNYGLKNVYYAPITGTTTVNNKTVVTYKKPNRLLGAVNMTSSAEGNVTDFHADDMVFFSAFANNGYKGTLELADLPEEFYIDILGQKLDIYNNLVENSKPQPKPFALLFEFDGDKKSTRHCFFQVDCTRPGVNGSTKNGTITVQTLVLEFTAKPNENGDVKTKSTMTSTNYDEWYNAVPLEDCITDSVASV